jgi:hypothetical protein
MWSVAFLGVNNRGWIIDSFGQVCVCRLIVIRLDFNCCRGADMLISAKHVLVLHGIYVHLFSLYLFLLFSLFFLMGKLLAEEWKELVW